MTDKKMVALGIIGGLALLARTDNIFLVAAAFLWVFADRKRISWTAIGWSAAVIAPWLAFNLITFGTVVQSSANAYPWILHQEFQGDYLLKYLSMTITEWNMLGTYFGSPVLLAILLIGLWFTTRRSWTLLWPVVAIVAMLAFHTYIRWFPRPWYQQSAFIVILILSGELVWGLRRQFLMAVGTVFLACFIFTITATGGVVDGWKKQTRERVAVQMVRQYVPAGDTIGAWNSGYLMYWIGDRNPCINLDGLANNEVMAHYKDRTIGIYLRAHNVKWIADAPSYFRWTFGRYFDGGIEGYIGQAYAADNIGLPGNSMWLAEVKGR
ncbi:MAG: hypothetical protein WC455_12300 [Dehalococcoidia bacterium]|jgi:hypothetical protein